MPSAWGCHPISGPRTIRTISPEAAASAFADGQDPETFIATVFEEDLARMEGDAQDFADAMQATLDGDES